MMKKQSKEKEIQKAIELIRIGLSLKKDAYSLVKSMADQMQIEFKDLIKEIEKQDEELSDIINFLLD